MKLYVGVTDSHWFSFLKEQRPDEVNFWRPNSTNRFRVISPGELFLFKLHSPRNFIAGGGFLVKGLPMKASLAWDAYEKKNGAPTRAHFFELLSKYRKTPEPDPEIGSILLAQPFFWEERDWIPVPADWSPNIVSGKGYDLAEAHGAALHQAVMDRLQAYPLAAHVEGPSMVAQPRYGTPFLAKPRLGQGAFRALVTEAYGKACALTGDHTLPVLEAAHIKPFSEEGPHQVSNGILMRSDLHILFDRHYLTITPGLRVEVSSRLREDFQNGKIYYEMHGHQLQVLPSSADDCPAREFLEWHNERFIA